MQEKQLSRRGFLRMSAMTAAGAALVACVPAAPQAGGGSAPAADKSLSFWMWNTFAPPADELMQEKLNEWAGANGVTIEISRDADSNMATKLLPAIEGGTLPDAMFVDAGNALRLSDAQALDPLTDLFPEIGDAHGGWQPRLAEPTSEQREQGEVRLPLTVIVSYRDREQTVRLSRTTDVIIKLDTTRLRRRVDSKLNLLMGKVPKGLQG